METIINFIEEWLPITISWLITSGLGIREIFAFVSAKKKELERFNLKQEVEKYKQEADNFKEKLRLETEARKAEQEAFAAALKLEREAIENERVAFAAALKDKTEKEVSEKILAEVIPSQQLSNMQNIYMAKIMGATLDGLYNIVGVTGKQDFDKAREICNLIVGKEKPLKEVSGELRSLENKVFEPKTENKNG
ncbi:MAG: hypothetical protein EOM59_17225 [Clostridia bacterium]|nr:hypothetical protein [Clostridia bacterium]